MPRFLAIVGVDGETIRSYGVEAPSEELAHETALEHVRNLTGAIVVPYPNDAMIDLDLDYDLTPNGVPTDS